MNTTIIARRPTLTMTSGVAPTHGCHHGRPLPRVAPVPRLVGIVPAAPAPASRPEPAQKPDKGWEEVKGLVLSLPRLKRAQVELTWAQHAVIEAQTQVCFAEHHLELTEERSNAWEMEADRAGKAHLSFVKQANADYNEVERSLRGGRALQRLCIRVALAETVHKVRVSVRHLTRIQLLAVYAEENVFVARERLALRRAELASAERALAEAVENLRQAEQAVKVPEAVSKAELQRLLRTA